MASADMSFESRVTSHEQTLSGAWTVVPVRGIVNGKSRLATVLDHAARVRLNRQLLERTLTVVDRWGGLCRCIVVTPCDEALAIARRLGAAAILETPEAGGLNKAAVEGASYAIDRGATSVLILPCDLPYLTPEALAAMTSGARTPRHMVIAPDKAGTGTNALLVSAQRPFEFHYGERSFERHLLVCGERGWTAVICRRPELAFDLDTPQDLAAWETGDDSAPAKRPMI
jgi:2-phospho-L-lactate/phosphoenolpyruvate guanylyltransferase